jgi:hypothetical protein
MTNDERERARARNRRAVSVVGLLIIAALIVSMVASAVVAVPR